MRVLLQPPLSLVAGVLEALMSVSSVAVILLPCSAELLRTTMLALGHVLEQGVRASRQVVDDVGLAAFGVAAVEEVG
jgi:hypothetical protein